MNTIKSEIGDEENKGENKNHAHGKKRFRKSMGSFDPSKTACEMFIGVKLEKYFLLEKLINYLIS